MCDYLHEFPSIRRLDPFWAQRFARDLLPGRETAGAYLGPLDVPHYETREVCVIFIAGGGVAVFSDGPTSPHRYISGALCMWYPDDPENRRWTPDDGFTELLFRVRNHLFREAYWREYGVWLGDEKAHGSVAA